MTGTAPGVSRFGEHPARIVRDRRTNPRTRVDPMSHPFDCGVGRSCLYRARIGTLVNISTE